MEKDGVSDFEKGKGNFKVPKRMRRGYEMCRKVFALLTRSEKEEVFSTVDSHGFMPHHYAAISGNIQLLKVSRRALDPLKLF